MIHLILAVLVSQVTYAQLRPGSPIVISPRCPYIISKPGSYVLNSDMVCSSPNQSAILIQKTSQVNLNLNGHKLQGAALATSLGATAIQIDGSNQVTITGSGATILKFGYGVEILNSQNVSIRSASNARLTLEGDQGAMRALGVTGLLVSGMTVHGAQAGIELLQDNGFQINDVDINWVSTGPSTSDGITISSSVNGRVTGFKVARATKSVVLSSSSQIQFNNLILSQGGFQGVELSGSNNINISNSTLEASTPVITNGGSPQTVFNAVIFKPSSGNFEMCWYGGTAPPPAATPQLINVTPATTKLNKCPFWN